MMNCSNVTLHKHAGYNIMKVNPPIDLKIHSWVKPIMYKDMSYINKKNDSIDQNLNYSSNSFESLVRKRGIVNSKKIYDLPWIISESSTIGNNNNKFIGRRETSSLSSRYFILAKGSSSFEAYPLSEWFNLSRTVNFRYLSFDQAEEHYKCRNKTLNLSLMMKNANPDKENSVNTFPDKSRIESFYLKENENTDSDSSFDTIDGNFNFSKLNKSRRKVMKSDDEKCDDSDEGDMESREQEYFSDTPTSSNDDLRLFPVNSKLSKENVRDDVNVIIPKTDCNQLLSNDQFYLSSSSGDEFLSDQGKAIKALMEDPIPIKQSLMQKDTSSGDSSDDLEIISIPKFSGNNQAQIKKSHLFSTSILNHPNKKQKIDIMPDSVSKLQSSQLSSDTLKILESEVKKYLTQGPKSGKSIARKLNKIFPEMHPDELFSNISGIMKSCNIVKKKNSDGKLLFMLK